MGNTHSDKNGGGFWSLPVPIPRKASMSTTTLPADKFQSRDELVTFIEQQTASAVEKATRVERRVPWVTSGPVCHDSAGYSVLKAAAFALGFVGADQAKEEIHAHQQLRDRYAGYGFSP